MLNKTTYENNLIAKITQIKKYQSQLFYPENIKTNEVQKKRKQLHLLLNQE